ncbi:MAG: right-handed parallel beta-helix repeat-containing protein, partial [Candidatus Eisenbacteria bacterium]
LAFLLDKVDGELARLQGTQNLQGVFLDRMHHRLVEPCLFVAVAVHEHLRTGSLVPLAAGVVTVVLANAIEENQHLAAYIVYKRVREGGRLPDGGPPRRSAGWARAAALLRPLKGFRMFIVALPLLALSYVLEWGTGRPVPTFVLAASACGLAVYLVFQCLYYLREQLDAEAHAIAGVMRTATAPSRPRPLDGTSRDTLANGDDLMPQSKLRFGSTLVFAGLVVAAAAGEPAPAGAAGTYFVDGSNPACSNSGPGTSVVPYCTITAALAAEAGPATTIRVAPGVYREQVTIPASGTAGIPLVIQGDGTSGNPVLIEGGEIFSDPALWSPAAGTTWLATSVTWNALMVLVDGGRLVPWDGPVQQLPEGGFKYDAGVGLYVNLGPGGNPGDHETVVSRRTHGVFVNGRAWVTIRGLSIRQTNDRGIQVTNSNNIVVENNLVERVQRFGIQAQNSRDVLVSRNRVTASGDHGITFTAGTRASTIEYNESDHNARPGVRAANGVHLFGAPANTVRRNRLHHNQDTGLHVQAASDTTLSYQNTSWANG